MTDQSEEEAIAELHEGLRIMRHAMQGGQGKVYVELGDAGTAFETIQRLQQIVGVEIVEMTFPDERTACLCLGKSPGHPGEEKYALQDARAPLVFLSGLPDAAVIDFVYTASSVEDLHAALHFYELGVKNIF